jgi:hypothetical protein
MTDIESRLTKQAEYCAGVAPGTAALLAEAREYIAAQRRAIELQGNELRSVKRERDEWHGRAAESVMLRRERDELAALIADQKAAAERGRFKNTAPSGPIHIAPALPPAAITQGAPETSFSAIAPMECDK